MGTVTLTDEKSSHLTSYDTTNYSYASISSASNAYADSSNSSGYATINLKTGSNAETYVYYKFDFSNIPSGATITSVSAKAKGYISSTSSTRITSRQMQLATGTTLMGSALTISNTATEQTFSSVGDWDRSKVLDAGIRFYAKRGTSNTNNNYYIRAYGATMTVEYSYQATTYSITVSNSTSATVTTSDDSPIAGDDVYITASTLSGITITDNGSNVTSQFVQGPSGTDTQYPDSYTTGGSINGTYYQQAIGKGSNTSNTSGNDYFSTVQGGSGSTWIDYFFDFSAIPAAATITSMTVTVKGHCEDASQSREIANVQLYSGTTAKGTSVDFTSTSDSVKTITAGTWTASELAEAKMRFTIGVYGGRISGATWVVVYEVDGYIYTISSVAADHTIVVASSGGSTPTLYFKSNGSWVAATAVYKKVNGSWVLQNNLSTVFDANTNYVKG